MGREALPHGALMQSNEIMQERQRPDAWRRADSRDVAMIIITSVDGKEA